MFSNGQLIFAGCFVVAFVGLMIWSYAKDKKSHQIHYKSGAFKVGIACIVTIFVFIVLRIIIH